MKESKDNIKKIVDELIKLGIIKNLPDKLLISKGISGHIIVRLLFKNKSSNYLKIFSSENGYYDIDLYKSENFVLGNLNKVIPLPNMIYSSINGSFIKSPTIITEELKGQSLQSLLKTSSFSFKNLEAIIQDIFKNYLEIRNYAEHHSLEGIYPNWIGEVNNIKQFIDLGIKREIRKFEKTMDAQSIAFIDRVKSSLNKRIEKVSNYKYYISHGDFTDKNIIVQENKVSGFIDWEFAYWGVLEKDLSDLLVSIIRDSVLDPKQVYDLFKKLFKYWELETKDMELFMLFRVLNSLNNMDNLKDKNLFLNKISNFYTFN